MGSSEPIRRTVTVACSAERAFDLFTAGMGTCWPVESYSRAASEFADEGVSVDRLEFQARLGGSVLEHMSDGRIMHWADVLGWDPPRSVLLAWAPHSMPEPPTELEATFGASGPKTVLELEHRGWERLSPQFREGLYDIYVQGWTFTLQLFADVAERDARTAGSG